MTTGALTKSHTANYQKVRQLLEQSKEEMANALPTHLPPERMIRVSLTSLRKNPKLLECDPLSIIKAIMEASQLGLETDGVLGHAYLVPYGDECQLLPGYKGLVALCRRSGEISELVADVVREGDAFEFRNVPPKLEHTATSDPSSKVTHVYAWVRLKDGGQSFVCWTTAQIESHRTKYSRSSRSKDSAWMTAWDWMAKKTVLKQLVKLLPVSVELQRLVARDEQVESETLYGSQTSRHSRARISTLMDRATQPVELPETNETEEEPMSEEVAQMATDLFDRQQDATEAGM
jgi:recombination protein RecT